MRITVLIALLLTSFGVFAAQKLAIPSYFPTWTDAGQQDWAALATPNTGLLVFNPHNGPIEGQHGITSYMQEMLPGLQANGIKVVGYVHLRVRGSRDKRDFADLKADIDLYFEQFPNLDGIFVDEAGIWTRAGSCYDANNIGKQRLEQIYNHVKGVDPSLTVVTNPGANHEDYECYMDFSDIMVSFENRYECYMRDQRDDNTDHCYFANPEWVDSYPSDRFWHLIHGAEGEQEMLSALQKNHDRGGSWVYITDLDHRTDNVWRQLPEYWKKQSYSACGLDVNLHHMPGF